MSQKAAVWVTKKEYPVLQDREIPKPTGQDALIKITSVGLNPVDWKIIEYGLYGDPPKILGIDLAGVIEEVGPDVKGYKKGDRIVSSATGVDFDHGGYQQYALVGTSPNLTAKLPDNITDDEAATLPTAINTAQVALYDKDGHHFPNPFDDSSFGKGKAFLVVGGSSIIGLAGFETIITTANPKHESLVKSYGATHLIDRSLPPSTQISKIKALAPDLQYAFDAIGTKETNLLSAASFGSLGGDIVSSLGVAKEVLEEYPRVRGRGIYSGPQAHAESAARIWGEITGAIETGLVRGLPYRVHEGGLGEIGEALEAVKRVSGYKIVVHPQE